MSIADAARLPPIVDATWLRRRMATDPAVVVCHVGSTMAGPEPRGVFEQRHLPGARFVSLDDDLAAAPSGTAGRHPLPDPADFARSMGGLGIAEAAVVVAYDDRGGAFAGRLVWMLRILGQSAALLDGGLDTWDGEFERTIAAFDPVDRSVREWPLAALADANDVARHIAEGGTVIDSRDPARYTGKTEPIDAVAGHIPGAANLLFSDNLGTDGTFRSADALTARFTSIIGGDTDPIVHCGSGVTACHNALAMEYVGLGLPRVYVGSWSGWIADPDRPVATGAAR